jgi:hypothetical protein
VPKDTKYPFVVLGKLLVFDRSVKDVARVHFLQEIRAYSIDESIETILSWGEVIKKELCGRNIVLGLLSITEVLFLEMELDVMTDGRTYKMIMKFKFNVGGINVGSERITNAA